MGYKLGPKSQEVWKGSGRVLSHQMKEPESPLEAALDSGDPCAGQARVPSSSVLLLS